MVNRCKDVYPKLISRIRTYGIQNSIYCGVSKRLRLSTLRFSLFVEILNGNFGQNVDIYMTIYYVK